MVNNSLWFIFQLDCIWVVAVVLFNVVMFLVHDYFRFNSDVWRNLMAGLVYVIRFWYDMVDGLTDKLVYIHHTYDVIWWVAVFGNVMFIIRFIPKFVRDIQKYRARRPHVDIDAEPLLGDEKVQL